MIAPEAHRPGVVAPSEIDLDDLRRRNAELAEAVATPGHVRRCRSYELRNPMTLMIGLVELLLS